MIRYVVLDLGQVLASPSDLFRAPAGLLGVDADALAGLYWTDRRDYDTGGPSVNYWGPILDALGVSVTEPLVAQLAGLDADLWTELRPSALELVRTVHSWGVPLAILSNAPHEMGPAVRASAWVALFERVFISAEMGLTKPDPAIYAEVTAALGVAPGEIAFIDDRAPNSDAAAAFGWQSHLWIDDTDSLTWLRGVCVRA